jgi:hypothetical protein
MIFQNQLRNPRIFMPIGMMCLVLALLSQKFLHPATKFGQDWFDAVCGLLFGLSIGMNLMSMVLSARQRGGTCR